MTYAALLDAPLSVILQMEIMQAWCDRRDQWRAVVRAGQEASAKAQGRRRGGRRG